MKTTTILFTIIALMHSITFMNILIFDGEWNGIVLFLSIILFITAVFYFSIEVRARIKRHLKTVS
ncbi:hypothetical protein LCL89_09335 [Halobacillus yeomjeoni]|uniref:hypothetical protein n=1 Tax=Halobacillus yeomjeoni TaxID=311194 RepID=UPI001CD19499|nr:hypothetical protein [Halobacillus yeomjeoni]MCA0984246.1 hypothetical protein [Halobacillus yeomjeoni]